MKRVLHVVGRMDRAGQETFLMNVLRAMPKQLYEFTFSVNTDYIGVYEDEIIESGGKIWHNPYAPTLKQLFKYLRSFREFLIKTGPYDIIHCHVYYFSGFLLREAAKCGIPIRIMHSHSTSDGYKDNLFRKFYRKLSISLIKNNATHYVACGKDAYVSFFGQDVQNDKYILNNAILPERFNLDEGQRDNQRCELKISQDAIVIISIARFCKVKNHSRIISIFKKLLSINPNSILLLVGEGALKRDTEDLCNRLGMQDKVKFLGARSDVPMLLNASDCLLMPSLFEGLPVTLIEAQAAGLPCVISSNITKEVDLGLDLVHFIDLDKSDHEWAVELSDASKSLKPDFGLRLGKLAENGYTIEKTWEKLIKIYDENPKS